MATKKTAMKIYVDPNEYVEIIQSAERTQLSVSTYVRRLCLGMPTPTFEKQKAVRELLGVNADLGRLGGLLKMWLMDEDRNQREAERLLHELQQIKALLVQKIEAL
ncbi:plasmid mobilization protein [Nitratidesulfovibrio liaohensis]|jgi:hypothetical protein|uniref:Conjugal transfer protein TraJ n=1 Tax=Nitratidesulfovibrio liaohensis TaxID=2604158 RepID=A0ABY9R3I3_9BACT|nr:conjugal transfer protein TraJ [Nitratidesulfovibrio liaohensis]WMW66326.1 conjugal transfer protein TraJ [Nitratidesulfovibrio liaohensis]